MKTIEITDLSSQEKHNFVELPAKNRAKLSKKERTFVREYAKGANATEAVLIAYDTDKVSTAAPMGSRLLDKLDESFPDLMNRIGATDEALLEPIIRNLRAKRSYYSKALGDMITEDDGLVQLKAVELGFKLKGRLNKDDKAEKTFNFTITRGETVTALEPIVVPEPKTEEG